MCIKDANINTNKQAKHVNDKKVYSKRKIVLITVHGLKKVTIDKRNCKKE